MPLRPMLAAICTAALHCVFLAASLPLFVLVCLSLCLTHLPLPFVCLSLLDFLLPILFFSVGRYLEASALGVTWGLVLSGLWVAARLQSAVKCLFSWRTSARSLLQIPRQDVHCQHCPETAQSRLPLQHHQTEL